MQADLAKVEASAVGHWADFERERADRLMAELLRATADTMAAKETAARLEGGLARLRQELSDVHSDRDAWRSEVERLILIEYRRNGRERLPWWKWVAGRASNPTKTPPALGLNSQHKGGQGNDGSGPAVASMVASRMAGGGRWSRYLPRLSRA